MVERPHGGEFLAAHEGLALDLQYAVLHAAGSLRLGGRGGAGWTSRRRRGCRHAGGEADLPDEHELDRLLQLGPDERRHR
eukprot:7965113-Pyramimonas_sp.AAC.1